MAWNPSPTLGTTNWFGNPQVALASQLVSTTSTILFDIQSSINYTTTTSNALQGQINSLSLSTGTASSWYLFPALSTVSYKNNYIVSTSIVANDIKASTLTVLQGITGNLTGNVTGSVTGGVNGPVSGNVTGNVTGNLTGNVRGNIYNDSLTVGGKYSITETVDAGSAVIDYPFNANLNLTAKGGLGGLVNITADVATSLNPLATASQLKMEAKGNYGLITPGSPVGYVPRGGLVQITAGAGITPTPPAIATSVLLANGEIDLTAYSYGANAGVIKLSAGANMIYAGPATPYFGLYGQNTIYGQTANSMIAGAVPVLPTLVGTNYFYGALGALGPTYQICGNRMQGGFAPDFIQPFPNGDLYIQSNANGTDTVIMRGIKSIAMSNAGNITNVGDIGLTTINGAAYPPVGSQTFAGISTNNISSGSAYFSSINGYPFNSLVPNTQYVSSILTSSGTVVSGMESTQSLLVSSINGAPVIPPNLSTLYISSGTVASGTTSTQNLLVSSINGAPIVPQYLSSLSVSTGTVKAQRIDTSILYVSTLFVSTSYVTNTIDIFASTISLTTDAIFTSSIQVTGGLTFVSTNAANYDISHNFTSTTVTYDNIANTTNNLVKYSMTAISTSTPENFDMGGWFEISPYNRSAWLQKQLNYTNITLPGQAPTINILKQAYTVGDYFDVKNLSGTAIVNVWNPYISGGLLQQMIPGSYYRFTYAITGTWTPTANPTPTGTTTTNAFTITQGFANTVMSTNNQLLINTAQTVFNNVITAPSAYLNTLYGNLTLNSTFVGNTVSTQALTLSSFNGLNLSALINPDQSYFSSIAVSTQKLTASSISGLLQYNITSTIANVADILSVNNNILTASMVLTSPVPILGMTFNFVFNDANYEYWNNTGFKPDASYTSQIQNIQTLVTHTTGQVDFYIGFAVTVQINYPGGSTLIGDFSTGRPGQARFTFAAGVWTFTNTFTGGNVVNSNTLTIAQNVGQTVIQTSDAIVVSTSAFLTNSDMYLGKVNAQVLNVSSISTGTLSIGSLSLPGNVQTAGFLSTGTNLYVGDSGIINNNILIGSNIYNNSTIYGNNTTMSTMNTNTGFNTVNILNQKIGNTVAFYNTTTSTYTTNAQTQLAASASIYGNLFKYYALPGLLDTTIQNGLPPNQLAYFKNNGTITLNGNPIYPLNWFSSICVMYPSANNVIQVDYTNSGNAEFIIQSMNTTTFNVRVTGGVNQPVTPTTIPSYWKIGFNALSNVLINAQPSGYVSTLVTEQTGWGISANSNVNLIAKSLSYNSKFPVIFYQNFSANLNPGAGGTVSAASASNVLTYNGQNFPVNQWSCYLSFYNINLAQNNLALNNFNVTTYNSGGNWGAYCYTGTATITGAGQQNINWNVQVMMMPKEIALQQNYNKYGDDYNPIDDLPPSTFTSTVATFGRLVMPELHLSSLTASTFTFQAKENLSINANVSTPTFLGSGNVAINAQTNIDFMANFDMNIDAGDAIFIQGNSTINLTSYNPAQPATFVVINDGDPFFANGTTISLQNVSTYDWYYLYLGDGFGNIYYNGTITIPPGGLYTFTITTAIPSGNYLQVAVGDVGGNSINEILINSSGIVSYMMIGGGGTNPVSVGTGTSAQPETGQINMTASTIYLQNYVDISGALFAPQLLGISSINGAAYSSGGGSSWVSTATSDLDMNGFRIASSNATPGFWTAARWYLDPPTYSVGNGAQIQVSAHEQDVGAITTLSMGVDLNAGVSFINSAWDGYINLPLSFTGSEIDINTNSGLTSQFIGDQFFTQHTNTVAISTATINLSSITNNNDSIEIIANNNINTVAISTINTVPATFFSGDVRLSTLNSHPVGWMSTINLSYFTSTYTGNILTTPQENGVVITFPYNGQYIIRRKLCTVKVSGGASQVPNLLVMLSQSSNAPSISLSDQEGFASFPYFNDLNASTFTTLQTNINVTNAARAYRGYLYDDTGNNYTASVSWGALTLQYVPPPSP
jgi:cytoskeletal protein CcmA (bactofilin family)